MVYILQKKLKEFNKIGSCQNFFRLLLFVFFLTTGIQAGAQSKKYAIKKIVIDAGHGGHDSGCRGKFSNEKDVALSVSLKFGKLVEENMPEVKVVYTRKTDVFVTLNDRAEIANDNKADFFICIHCNAGSKTADGTETYVMGLHRTEENLHVAQRENASILMEDDYKSKYEGFNPNSPEAYISFALYQNAFLDQSLSMASKIEDQFRVVGRQIRGVKQAGFWVLYRTTMPSILIETGFLTNPEEEKYLNSEKGQNEIANSIYKAFREYRIETEGKLIETKEIKIEKPIVPEPEKVIVPARDSIYFSVQLGTGSVKRPMDLKKDPYSQLQNIFSEQNTEGTIKYMIGSFTNYDECLKFQNELKEKGVKGSFIVAYNNRERIHVSKAREISLQNK